MGTAASIPTPPSTLQHHPGAEILYLSKNVNVGLEKDLWLFFPPYLLTSPHPPCPVPSPVLQTSLCRNNTSKPPRQMPGGKNLLTSPSHILRKTQGQGRVGMELFCARCFLRGGESPGICPWYLPSCPVGTTEHPGVDAQP